MLKLAISGASGRVGQFLLDATTRDASVAISGAFVSPKSTHVGTLSHGVVLHADADAAIANADVLIDFTRPEGTLAYLALCATHGKNAVIGTTGFSQDERAQIASYAERIAIVFAPNMALGVNVTAKLVEMAAKSLGMDADIEVFEAHHKLKVDAPSGTALMLGDVAAQARGQALADVAVHDRHGQSGARKPGTIGFTSLRAGDIVGDHTVYFVLNGERIEITHKSASRATYADGAIRAAKFLADKKSGLFNMHDVLGL
jgi:4-hydroxy-tetrahydrodipicolinate reductase